MNMIVHGYRTLKASSTKIIHGETVHGLAVHAIFECIDVVHDDINHTCIFLMIHTY